MDPASSSFFKPTDPPTPKPSASSPSPIDALHTTKALAFDPNILIAQVQAAKADDDADNIGTTGGRPSEENNLIPFADVAVPAVPPSAEGAPTAVGDVILTGQGDASLDDSDITVINLQRNKGKQNFKGFVDTDLIDDSLRHREDDHEHGAGDGHVHQPFIPTRSPVVKAPPPSTVTTKAPSNVFIPTSLPFAVASQTSTSTEGRRASPPASINEKLDRLQSNLDPWAHIQVSRTR